MARTQDAQLFSELAAGFATAVKDKASRNRTARFKAWLASARKAELNAFVRGIDRDRDAVLAALVEPWSTGPVEGIKRHQEPSYRVGFACRLTEGQINRLRLLKRSICGRANHGLLRRRVLAAA